MIPGAEEIIAGYRFAAQRWKLSGDLSEAAVRAAVEDALAFAEGDPDAEAAALFFAFARRPRAFPGCTRSPRVHQREPGAESIGRQHFSPST